VRIVSITVRIPGALRSHTGGATQVELEATSVGQALHSLEERFPALVPLLRDEGGALRLRVSIFVNDQHVRYQQGLQTPLRDGDQVFVMPTAMGG
jgi:molybdopterin synthase sulfur carrier subunit